MRQFAHEHERKLEEFHLALFAAWITTVGRTSTTREVVPPTKHVQNALLLVREWFIRPLSSDWTWTPGRKHRFLGEHVEARGIQGFVFWDGIQEVVMYQHSLRFVEPYAY